MRRRSDARAGRVVPWAAALSIAGLLAGAVAGCGDAGGRDASDPRPGSSASGPSSTPSSGSSSGSASAGDAVDFELVRVLSATSAGGQVSTTGVPVPDVAAARAFAQQFGDNGLGAQVVGAVGTTRVPDGRVLYAATVGIGCSPTEAVEVTRDGAGYRIEGTGEPSPGVQCFAPVTSVALVLVAG